MTVFEQIFCDREADELVKCRFSGKNDDEPLDSLYACRKFGLVMRSFMSRPILDISRGLIQGGCVGR